MDTYRMALPAKATITVPGSAFKAASDIEDMFAHAPKSTISLLKVADVRLIFQYMVQPTLQLPEEDVRKLTKAKLEALIAVRVRQGGQNWYNY